MSTYYNMYRKLHGESFIRTFYEHKYCIQRIKNLWKYRTLQFFRLKWKFVHSVWDEEINENWQTGYSKMPRETYN